ncbi:MAG: competence/damage-inducible protein A [Proteobacteria bacterium]|nr:competence/damage-inducible protein A [Pseudomonadota bacterium]
MPIAEILSQGDEVVTGQVADTNAAWLAEKLSDMGFRVSCHTAVGDSIDDLVPVLRQAAQRCDVAISTGGLGPTEDDLTALAVEQAFSLPLELHEVALEHIQAIYAHFGRTMPEINRKQALLPTGSAYLENLWGTAPGFAVQSSRAWMAFLPGVPREMRKMFFARVEPQLRAQFSMEPRRLITLRTTGIGESNLQERVGHIDHPHVTVSYRTHLPENHVKLIFDTGAVDAFVHQVVGDVAQRIRTALFSIEGLESALSESKSHTPVDFGGGSLMEVVARALTKRGDTLATAESCTGGRVAAMCTAISGSSAWFQEGAVTYSNQAKVRLLGVQQGTLDGFGAVSEEVANAMALGVRQRANTTYGLATTGVAGPGGGSAEKPVGTVHIALAAPDGVHHRLLRLAGDRHRVQMLAAAAVVDLLRRHLSSLLPTQELLRRSP